MKAVLVRKHGGYEALEIADLPRPKAGAGQAILEVKAAGLNHLDTWVRRGMPGVTLPLPMILGSDAAGLVAEIGPGVTHLKPGDRVFVSPGTSCGRCEACLTGQDPLCRDYSLIGEHCGGTQAAFVALPAAALLPLPDGVSFEEGAAFPLVFLTAWHMLVGRAGVRVGDLVLVQAAGSGVGSAALQIARLHGARVLATVGSDVKVDKARALGADEVINHRTADVLHEVRRLTGKRGVDIVVDSVGQETWDTSLKALARGGRLVTCGATSGYQGTTDLRYLFSRGLSILGSTMGSRAELLRLARLVGERRLLPVIDRVLPLERVAEGHRAMAERSLFGKIILKP
ncbi:MAG TPA: zinc-binding dehydrogenase [Candidatus Polarisedimenticolia bacterium]|nr:zinc-binding dehydrogenase [Candidatus Polarisedimenticolia bacterium]